MSEGEHKGSVQHTPAEWTSSNQDQYVTADKARYNSEKVSGLWELLLRASFAAIMQRRQCNNVRKVRPR